MKILEFKFLFLATALFVGCLTGCSNDSIEDLHPGIYGPDTIPCDTANMTYEMHMKPLFLSKCGSDQTDCHKSPNTPDINLDNYFDARDLAVNGDMMDAILHKPGSTPM